MKLGQCIVDTNVPIVANGDNKAVCYECRFKTIDFLEKLMKSGRLVIDLGGAVETEYWNHLRTNNPGVGNRFIQHFFAAHSDRIDRVEIEVEKGAEPHLAFSGPLKNFDPSDRKFATLSKVTGQPIYVAIDSDWAISGDDLRSVGVTIEFLCGENQKGWFMQADD